MKIPDPKAIHPPMGLVYKQIMADTCIQPAAYKPPISKGFIFLTWQGFIFLVNTPNISKIKALNPSI